MYLYPSVLEDLRFSDRCPSRMVSRRIVWIASDGFSLVAPHCFAKLRLCMSPLRIAPQSFADPCGFAQAISGLTVRAPGDDRSRPLPPDGGTARSLRFRIAVKSSVSVPACGPESGVGISPLRQTAKGDFHRQRLVLPIHNLPGCPSQIVFQCGNRESAPRPQTACLRMADCLPTHFRQVDSFVAIGSITKGILRMI